MFYSLPQSEAKSKKVKSHGQVIVFGRVRAGASLARSSPGPHLANISLFFRFLSFMGHSLFFRPALNAFPDIGSVGRIEKGNLKKKIHRNSLDRKPGTPALLLWSPET